MELSGERPVRWTSKFNFNYSPTDYKTVWYIQNQKLIQRREEEDEGMFHRGVFK